MGVGRGQTRTQGPSSLPSASSGSAAGGGSSLGCSSFPSPWARASPPQEGLCDHQGPWAPRALTLPTGQFSQRLTLCLQWVSLPAKSGLEHNRCSGRIYWGNVCRSLHRGRGEAMAHLLLGSLGPTPAPLAWGVMGDSGSQASSCPHSPPPPAPQVISRRHLGQADAGADGAGLPQVISLPRCHLLL